MFGTYGIGPGNIPPSTHEPFSECLKLIHCNGRSDGPKKTKVVMIIVAAAETRAGKLTKTAVNPANMVGMSMELILNKLVPHAAQEINQYYLLA